MKNNFLKKHAQNVVEKLFPVPFLKNQSQHISGSEDLKFHAVCFYCMPKITVYQNLSKLSSRPLAFIPQIKPFDKTKKDFLQNV